MRTALSRHDTKFEEIVASHEGQVVRPRGEGDSRFAVFGRPADALHAACATQLMLQRDAWDLPEPLKVRMAVHTGDADLRDGDYYGNSVNRCARLRNLAHGGQILLSGVTASLIGDDLPPETSLRRLGIHRLRDLTEPEAVFQLVHPQLPSDFPPLGEAAVSARTSGVFAPAYPFPSPEKVVGREAELKALSWVLARGQAGQHTLFLGAPAGGGKSTLVGAAARRSIHAGALVLAGGCYDSVAAIPLRPVRDALGDYLLSRSPEDINAEFGDAAVELSSMIPELRHHLGLPSRSARRVDQSALFGAIHSCLRVLANKAPVVLCLEDLQLADAATLDLIHFLIRQVRRLPVVFIGTYRVEEVRAGQPLAQLIASMLREGAEQIEVPPFSRDDTTQLASVLLDGPTSVELNDVLYMESDGNPFFVEQLVLTLREEHRVERRDGVWHSIGDTRATVPAMVRELVVRRLDRLTERCCGTLAMIAVLGQSVDHATLIAALEAEPENEVLEDLEQAIDAHILRETATGYAFSHALVREAVYTNLRAPRRMRLHAVAARTLERLADGRTLDHAAELAHHFALAGRDATTRHKALNYSLEAGRKAATLSSHNEALAQYAQACTLLSDTEPPSVRLEALEGRGQAERNLGQWQNCVNTFARVLEQSMDTFQRVRAYGAIGRALAQLGKVADALETYATGQAELQNESSQRAAAAHVNLSFGQVFCYLLQGEFRRAARLGDEMLEIARDLNDPGLLYRAHSASAVGFMYQGLFERALVRHKLAVSAAEASADKLLLAVGRENLGAHLLLSGDLESARSELLQAIALYRACVSDLRTVLALQVLCRVQTAQGHLKQAEVTITQARGLAVRGQDRWAAECQAALAVVQRLQGDWTGAEQSLVDALETFRREGSVVGSVECLIELAHVREHVGHIEEALARSSEALVLAQPVDPGPLVVCLWRSHGLLELRYRDAVEGARYIQTALKLANTMPASLEYAPTLLADAELMRQDDPTQAIERAHAALQAARTTPTQAEAHSFLAATYEAAGNSDRAREHIGAVSSMTERLRSS
jgi:predicted ATPase